MLYKKYKKIKIIKYINSEINKLIAEQGYPAVGLIFIENKDLTVIRQLLLNKDIEFHQGLSEHSSYNYIPFHTAKDNNWLKNKKLLNYINLSYIEEHPVLIYVIGTILGIIATVICNK